MSDFAEELRSLGNDRGSLPPHKTCALTLILPKLSDEEREAIEPLLAPDNRVASAKVASVLTKWGYPVNYQAIQRHRRRKSGNGCVCP